MLKFLKVKMIRLVMKLIFLIKHLKLNKCETRSSLRNEIESLHETLSKFTKGNVNLHKILSNQKSFV